MFGLKIAINDLYVFTAGCDTFGGYELSWNVFYLENSTFSDPVLERWDPVYTVRYA